MFGRDGDNLEVQYRHILTELGKYPGTLGVMFRKAQNSIQDPAKLRRLVVDLIGQESWTAMDADVKGDAYEGAARQERRGRQVGCGAVLHATRADPGDRRGDAPRHRMRICDPAAGTGGFLAGGHELIRRGYP